MSGVAVIILTFNEEDNLPAALDSVRGWSDEVYVVDSFSADRTVDLALARAADGVRVVQHAFVDYGAQWNWALANLPVAAPWTLKLDADERVTPAFCAEVDALAAAAPSDLEGVYFRRRIVFMGRELQWGGLTQNHDLRLWRTGRAAFERREVNEHAQVQGRTAFLSAFVRHESAKSVGHWLEKHARYAALEARARLAGRASGDVAPRLLGRPDERRMFLRAAHAALPFRNILYFLYRYVLRLGFLDGRAGFRFAFLHASYQYWIQLHLAEFRRTGVLPEVPWPARGAPHPAVAPDGGPSRVERP